MKQQIKAGVADTELVLLKISHSAQENRNEFQRIHAGEFRYRGKMYDVIREEKHGQVDWFYCVSDEKETLLFARLDERVKKEMQNSPGNEKQREKLHQWVNTLFFIEKKTLTVRDFNCCEQSTSYRFCIKVWESSPDTPPPWV